MPGARLTLALYRLLAAATAAFCALLAFVFLVAFLDRALFPVLARPLFDTNYWGYYVLALAGSVLLAWAGCLLSAARHPEQSAGVALASAAALIAAAIVRLLAWYSGEYRYAGGQLRLEAIVLCVLALGFVWLRPRSARR